VGPGAALLGGELGGAFVGGWSIGVNLADGRHGYALVDAGLMAFGVALSVWNRSGRPSPREVLQAGRAAAGRMVEGVGSLRSGVKSLAADARQAWSNSYRPQETIKRISAGEDASAGPKGASAGSRVEGELARHGDDFRELSSIFDEASPQVRRGLNESGVAVNMADDAASAPRRARFIVDENGVAEDTLPLAQPGEDLFVGSYSRSRAGNVRSGLNRTHTAHHMVADAISPETQANGLTINIQQRLHRFTRTFRRNPVRNQPFDLAEQLHLDVENVRRILLRDGYDYDRVERHLNELVRLEYQLYNIQ
jgi:hypothetical protein